MAKRLAPAVFLDRDGVLNEDLGYVFEPAQLRLLPGVGEALKALQAQGFRLIVVSNQSGVARGYYTTAAVERFHVEMSRQLAAAFGVSPDAYYYCPYHPAGSVPEFTSASPLRKPEPGMVLLAAQEHALDLKRSYLVGDKYDDVECAVRAGVQGLQVVSKAQPIHPLALAVVADLAAAAATILAAARS